MMIRIWFLTRPLCLEEVLFEGHAEVLIARCRVKCLVGDALKHEFSALIA